MGSSPVTLTTPGAHRVEYRRHYGGDNTVLHLLHRHTEQVQHILDLNSVLVGGLDPVGGNPRLKADLFLVDPSDHDVAVPNIDGKKHLPFTSNFIFLCASRRAALSGQTRRGAAPVSRSSAFPMAVTSTAAAMASGMPEAVTVAITSPNTASSATFFTSAYCWASRK